MTQFLNSIHPTWPFVDWLYFCILCKKNGIKGLWGQKGLPSLGLGPTLVLQWTLPWPYNKPDMVLYILAIFLHSMQQKWDQGTLGTERSAPIGFGTCLGPSIVPAMALKYIQHGPFIYWLYLFIICNKDGIKVLLGHKGQPSLVLGPPLFLQWTLPWP